MESAPAQQIFSAPQHPYTKGLLSTLPRPELRGQDLPVIEGSVPSRYDQFDGCRFAPRCSEAGDECLGEIPVYDIAADQRAACIKLDHL